MNKQNELPRQSTANYQDRISYYRWQAEQINRRQHQLQQIKANLLHRMDVLETKLKALQHASKRR
ncbi:hypothetical protein [Spirosoma harenae]